MISYWKTQWFRLLVAFVCLGISIYYAFQPAAETLTVETLDAMMSDMLTAIGYFFSFLIWITMSFIDYLSDCIELLEKKQERDDQMYELVQELQRANKIDRETIKALQARVRILEVKRNDH